MIATRWRFATLVAILATAIGWSKFCLAAADAAAPTTKAYVETLASDRFEGRLTGTNGEQLASDYIISQLKRIGARPLPGRNDYKLPFEFTAGTRDSGSTMTVDVTG